MAALHLAHHNLLVLSNSLRRFQDLDRILLIRKILFSIQTFQRQSLLRYVHAFLQLRDME
jgi:hypothetical protein